MHTVSSNKKGNFLNVHFTLSLLQHIYLCSSHDFYLLLQSLHEVEGFLQPSSNTCYFFFDNRRNLSAENFLSDGNLSSVRLWVNSWRSTSSCIIQRKRFHFTLLWWPPTFFNIHLDEKLSFLPAVECGRYDTIFPHWQFEPLAYFSQVVVIISYSNRLQIYIFTFTFSFTYFQCKIRIIGLKC